MFRMKFQSAALDYSASSDEEDVERSGDSSGKHCSPEPVVHFEGKVVKVTKSRPLPSADKSFADGHASLRNLILCPSAQVVPLPSSAQEGVTPAPEVVVAKPSNNLTDKKPALQYQDLIKDQAPNEIVLQDGNCAVLIDAKSDSESSECSTPTRRDHEADDEALTEIINKIMEERKRTLRKNVDNSTKPSEEPLLAAHDQEELDLKAKEEAKVEAKRIAEEERLERERDLRELRALAHCSTVGRTLGRSPTFKKSSKLKKILSKTGVTTAYRFLKSPFRIFRKKRTAYADAREAKVVASKASLFGGCRTVPSSGITDSHLAMMTNAPRPALTRRPRIQFATVKSTQRDVSAWTREEYLRKNGKIPQASTTSLEDEEFGGIEGNNLANHYFDDDSVADYDSDSD